MTSPDEAYEVGYGKPPKHTRFQKGRSGNPRGRPRGALNLTTMLEQILNERITINEQGRSRKRSRFELMLLVSATRAIKGDPRALTAVLGMMQRTGIGMGDPQTTVAAPLTVEDEAVIARALAALQTDGDDNPETGS